MTNVQKVNEHVAAIKTLTGFSACEKRPKKGKFIASKDKIWFEWFPVQPNYFEIKVAIEGSNVVWALPCNTLCKDEIKSMLRRHAKDWLAKNP